MDTEQIQRQMNAHRAAIDARLAVLAGRASDARRTARPIVIALAAGAAAVMLWRRWRRRAPHPQRLELRWA